MIDSNPKLSPQEYLALERAAPFKSEYYDGEMFARGGKSFRHSLLSANLSCALGNALSGKPCYVFSSALRLQVPPTGLYTYPDVMVACGELRFADAQKDTLLNPVLIAEVLSPSTTDYDRGGKFAHYRTLDSVQHYLLLSQDRHLVEIFTRQPDGKWLFSALEDDAAEVELSALGARLSVAALYDKVDDLPLTQEAAGPSSSPVLTSRPS